MTRPVLVCTLAIVLLLPLPGSALDLSVGSRTYLWSREDGQDKHYLTFFEYFDTDVGRPGGRGFSFHAGAWGRVDAQDPSWGEYNNGEIQYGYLEWTGETANATAHLGRMSVSEGVAAAEQVDGLLMKTDLWGGFAAALYGGMPVETDHDGRDGDSVYGGRISQGISGMYRIGVSFLGERNDSEDYREELGADLSFSPASWLDLGGISSYNTLDEGWMKHDYLLTVRPLGGLAFRGTFTWVDYDLFFRSFDNPAFIDPVDFAPGEEMLLAGGGIDWDVVGGLVLSLDYRSYSYEIAGSASSYGAALAWTGSTWGLGASGELMRGDEDELRYGQYRAWGTAGIGPVDATVDLLDTVYEEKVLGVKNAWECSAGLGYRLAGTLRLAADVVYAHNPWYDRETRGMLKIVYRFSGNEGGAP